LKLFWRVAKVPKLGSDAGAVFEGDRAPSVSRAGGVVVEAIYLLLILQEVHVDVNKFL
jgi:hypothetical protein